MIKDKLFLEEFDKEPIEEAKKCKRKHKKKPFSSMTVTTGDIGLNIDRFNTAMGTADTGESEGGAIGEGLKLKESWEEFINNGFNKLKANLKNKVIVENTVDNSINTVENTIEFNKSDCD